MGYDFALGERVGVLGTTSGFHPNGGFVGALGVAFAPSPRGPAARATIAIKQNTFVSDRAHLRYRSFPLEILAAWRTGALEFGAGVSLALRPSLGGSDPVSGLAAEFETSIGLVGQVEWGQLAPGTRLGSSFGARIIWQTLKARAGGTIAAPAMGLFAGLSY